MVLEDNYCLKWNDYQESISQSVQLFRKDLVDVSIFCGNKKVEAHRLVLCACSAVLRDIILENSSQTPSIILFDVELTELCNLVDFMYKGEVSVSQSRLQKFLDLAQKLEVKGLYKQDEVEKNTSSHIKSFESSKSTSTLKDVEECPETISQKPKTQLKQNFTTEEIVDSSRSDTAIIIKKEQELDSNEVLTVSDDYVYSSSNLSFQEFDYNDYNSYNNYNGSDNILNGDYPCVLCGKLYKTPGSLKNHRSLYHRDEITKNNRLKVQFSNQNSNCQV